MIDYSVVGDVATGVGTLVLAVATFASVRSANASARTAERALAAGLRPLLLPSRRGDESMKVRFGDGHYVKVDGGFGCVEVTDDAVYLAMNLRNAGQGIAIIHGWHVVTGTAHDASVSVPRESREQHAPVDDFRRHSRDMYVPGGDTGFWQGAIRAADDGAREAVCEQRRRHESLTVDVLYGDFEGGQRTITRFVLTPINDSPASLLSAIRHWSVDTKQPR